MKLFLLTGGQKDNAITREAISEILVAREDVEAVKASAAKLQKHGLREEYAGTDENITVQITEEGHAEQLMFFILQAVKKIYSI